MAKYNLDVTQEEALTELRQRVTTLADEAKELDGLPLLPIESKAIGILGPRGAGKSTVLAELYEDWEKKKKCKESSNFNKLYLLPPIDCSILPYETTPSTTVLLRLQESLEKYREDKKLSDSEKKLDNNLLEKLKKLVQTYSRYGEKHQDLYLELSSSLDDYGYYVTKDLKEQFALREELFEWLNDVLNSLDLSAFVVLLDDFDLAPATKVQSWLFSMLDVLHLPQLIFVLTADFYRLEYLSWDPDTRFDDKTGRALLNKLLRSPNRIELDPWSHKSRMDFSTRTGKEETLWEKILPIVREGTLEPLTAALLPTSPRGLLDLYHRLPSVSNENTAESSQTKENNKLSVKRFLSWLATCRNEPLLARHLNEKQLDHWTDILHLSEQSLSVEEWRDTIDAAAERPAWDKVKEKLPPLSGLKPLTEKEIRTNYPSSYEDGQQASPFPLNSIPNPLNRDPSWHDPLRHDRLRLLPLRDAAEEDQPFWAELLIDLGLGESQRRRISFLTSWRPTADRMEKARLKLTFTQEALYEFFLDNQSNIEKATLLWLKESTDPSQLEIGWYPLLEALRNARDPLSSAFLGKLLINLGDINGQLPQIGKKETLDLLPNKVWALILLADALYRCPWTAFSAPLGWRVVTYLGLAAAFVRSAYVHAMHKSKWLEWDKLSSVQKSFWRSLEDRDLSNLLQLDEEEILEKLIDLFGDGLQDRIKDKESTLGRAANAYLESPIYTSVFKLVELQLDRDSINLKIYQKD